MIDGTYCYVSVPVRRRFLERKEHEKERERWDEWIKVVCLCPCEKTTKKKEEEVEKEEGWAEVWLETPELDLVVVVVVEPRMVLPQAAPVAAATSDPSAGISTWTTNATDQ